MGHEFEPDAVIVGVDTHTDVHVAVALNGTGKALGTRSFSATTRGYSQLASWAEGLALVAAVGMEGTGSFGAGLLRILNDSGLTVVEVDRPDRRSRRRHGKADPLDAESAARAVLSGRADGQPKSRPMPPSTPTEPHSPEPPHPRLQRDRRVRTTVRSTTPAG